MMKRSIILAVAFSLVVLSGVSAAGTEQRPEPSAIADSFINHQFPAERVSWLIAQPQEFQNTVIRTVLLAKGYSASQTDNLIAELHRPLVSPQETGTIGVTGGSCSQGVEYSVVVRDPVWGYKYSSFQSNRGTEYLFYFSPWWTVDPNNIRWNASDGWVQYMIWLRTMFSGVAGANLCSKPFTLQLGDTTVGACGGAYYVLATLYVQHT